MSDKTSLNEPAPDKGPKVVKSDAEWLEQLGELAFHVTRRQATERPFSHDDFPQGSGSYFCVCCNAPLFESEARFDSGCGWPAFTRPTNDKIVGETTDTSHGMIRVEVHCNDCGAHLGHVFPDGPRDQGGLRYCINGVALNFKNDEA